MPMKAKRRRVHNLSRIRKATTYSIDEITNLLTVSKGTVQNWRKSGLVAIDGRKPILIHGSDLHAFLSSKQAARKRTCQPGEFYCLRCRAPRQPFGMMVAVEFRNQTFAQIRAICGTCSAGLNRVSSLAKLAECLKAFDHVTLVKPRLFERIPPSLNCYFHGRDE